MNVDKIKSDFKLWIIISLILWLPHTFAGIAGGSDIILSIWGGYILSLIISLGFMHVLTFDLPISIEGDKE